SQLIARIGNTAAAEDKPGYTGHLEDDDLSLTYMQQRYYDPVIGRFYSNDPVGFTASNPMMFNRYAYGNNNPYKYTDPTGETAEAVVLSRERGKVFVYPPSSHAHASKRHAQGYQGLGKGSPQQFMSKFGMQDYKMSATVVGAVVESGAEYYQEGTGTTVYTFETGQQIGELGETALSVATTPLSSLKDPAKIAEVTTIMTEAGVSQDQYGNVEVVTTIAPDNGTFKRDDAILMKKQE
ncbi:MAG: RHS repeat-associated core domain-containing protein, partial [Gammaproteobacteria bacterium]|nr:RHS repeat-associated core domain-containing protein [Gammaproteobacteria bacterium]